MAPSILPGDLISVQRAVESEVSSGEIVLYEREGRMFVHRVVGRAGSIEEAFADRGKSLLVTRGDRLLHNDAPVSPSELLGKVTSIERGNFQWQPAVCLTGWERTIVRLLRHSDQATYLYMRIAAFRQVGARHAVLLHGGACSAMTQLGGSSELRPAGGSVKCQV